MLGIKSDGDHWYIETAGVHVRSKNKDLLFDGLMIAMIDSSIPKDMANPTVVTIVKPETEKKAA